MVRPTRDRENDSEEKRTRRTRLDRTRRVRTLLLIGGIILVLGVIGTVAGVFPEAEPSASNTGRPVTIRPRNTDIWMVYPEQGMRFVTLFHPERDAEPGTRLGVSAAGPLITEEEDILAEEVIGGDLVDATVDESPANPDLLYTLYGIDYEVTAGPGPYGVDVRTTDSPYIAELLNDTLAVQLFAGPQDQYAEVVVAVAFPEDVEIIATSNPATGFPPLMPYHNITLRGWQVYYFDTTNLQEQHLIRIEYVPGTEEPSDLNPLLIDRQR